MKYAANNFVHHLVLQSVWSNQRKALLVCSLLLCVLFQASVTSETLRPVPVSGQLEFNQNNTNSSDTQSNLAANSTSLLAQQAASHIEGLPAEQGLNLSGLQPGELHWEISGLARVLYVNDQRIEFTGQEATFGVEAQLNANASQEDCHWRYGLNSEIYFTQPFDDNLLVDLPIRQSFAGNFDRRPLEISQLFVSIENGEWQVDLGRFVTPFGRFHAPYFTNLRNDVPFIRSESILFRETGINLRYEPDVFRFSLAATNGSEGRDTNSSKAIIGRIGVETNQFEYGASVKWQDGIGSESQKEFNNHAGIDASCVLGKWRLSGELIYDQYGMRRPGIPLNQITWGRSLYNRQLNNGVLNPITGMGWYLSALYENNGSIAVIGYGEFHPERIGDPIHDIVTHRIIGKYIYQVTPHLSCFCHATFENSLPVAQALKERKGVFLLGGIQYDF